WPPPKSCAPRRGRPRRRADAPPARSLARQCAPYHPVAMDQRSRRSSARFLAPLALIAIVVVVLMIVSGSGGGSSSKSADGTQTTTHRAKKPAAKTTTTGQTTTQAGTGPRSYTVQVGDTL